MSDSVSKLKLLCELLKINCLVRHFPKEVLGLPELGYLDLWFNDFEGPLPIKMFEKLPDAIFLNSKRELFLAREKKQRLGQECRTILSEKVDCEATGCRMPTSGGASKPKPLRRALVEAPKYEPSQEPKPSPHPIKPSPSQKQMSNASHAVAFPPTIDGTHKSTPPQVAPLPPTRVFSPAPLVQSPPSLPRPLSTTISTITSSTTRPFFATINTITSSTTTRPLSTTTRPFSTAASKITSTSTTTYPFVWCKSTMAQQDDGAILPNEIELLNDKAIMCKVSKKKDQFGSYKGPFTVSRITLDPILLDEFGPLAMTSQTEVNNPKRAVEVEVKVQPNSPIWAVDDELKVFSPTRAVIAEGYNPIRAADADGYSPIRAVNPKLDSPIKEVKAEVYSPNKADKAEMYWPLMAANGCNEKIKKREKTDHFEVGSSCSEEPMGKKIKMEEF
ncbi:leucine-rich repeat/extensin 2 [Striga hermonthica]|uniref:Leucine-rich repeat/extensin 2 n=1 Tax=Striga hermonthica TaxID=68872 RepID=A0A9N7RH07_STRHE|nr:leucine-rich repeat/extensin 2 [Striga hermonthica]